MPLNQLGRIKKEYITALAVVLVTAIIGLIAPDSTGRPPLTSQYLIFFVVIIAIIAGNLYFKFRHVMENTHDAELLHHRSRLYRMALLWYALSLVLAAPVALRTARGLFSGQVDLVASIEWLSGAASAAVGLFSLYRISFCLFKADMKPKLR